MTTFQWDVERFDAKDTPLPDLSRTLQAITDRIDVDIRGFFSTYSEKKQTLAALARRQTYVVMGLIKPLRYGQAGMRVTVACRRRPQVNVLLTVSGTVQWQLDGRRPGRPHHARAVSREGHGVAGHGLLLDASYHYSQVRQQETPLCWRIDPAPPSCVSSRCVVALWHAETVPLRGPWGSTGRKRRRS